ncbi:hypothetical protein, partial [Helicobacter sp. 11S02629-2]|uniref:hypothetical protein n=1 Tax=Helicobacter sp. 11S02629-2 TaxID=1476195 RepID=UPI001C5F00B7
DENGSFMNSSSAASSAVLAGATGIQAVAGQVTGNPISAATLISASSNLEASMQNLQNVISQIADTSARNSTLSTQAMFRAQATEKPANAALDFGWSTAGSGKTRNITYSGVFDFSQGFGELKILQDRLSSINSIYGTISNLSNPGNSSLSSLATSLNNIVNGNSTLISGNNGNIANSNINTTSQLIAARNQVTSAISQLSTILSSTVQPNNAISIAQANQLSALNELNTTLTTLQNAVKVNTENIIKIRPDQLNSTITSVDTAVSNAGDIALNKQNQNLDSPNFTTPDVNKPNTTIQRNTGKSSLIDQSNSIKNNVQTVFKNVVATQDSAQTIDGIINGNAKGEAIKVTTTVAPLSDKQLLQGAQTITQKTEVVSDNNGKTVKSLKQALADVKAANKAVDDAVLAVAINQNKALGAAAAQDANARKNKAPTILPTAKAGIVAFFGKHQSVSVEYQYYFRNTNPNFTSGEVTLNYAYYFGGK